MSETPTPSKGQTKRGGLALPPRGQTLARLQDLEIQEMEKKAEPDAAPAVEITKFEDNTASSNAVNTASSKPVIHQGSNTAINDSNAEPAAVQPVQVAATEPPPAAQLQGPSAGAAIVSGASISGDQASKAGYHPPARAAREPTTRITVDMPDSLHRKISLLSVETRRSIKDLVIEALAATYFGTDQTSE